MRKTTCCGIPWPGASEHQAGLAVDIVDTACQLLDEAQEDTPVQQWLMAHCAEYGFILRYPTGKSALTGVSYEPWHYRYVGTETARAGTLPGGIPGRLGGRRKNRPAAIFRVAFSGSICYNTIQTCGCSSLVERQLPKLHRGVRFPSAAPTQKFPVWHESPPYGEAS